MGKNQNKLNTKRNYKWQVIEGIVNTSEDYIKVVHEEHALPYALLQLGRCRTVIVEYYAGDKPWYAVVQTTLAKIREEISYYILQQHTPDNWKCAASHAKNSVAVCHKIHWLWHPKGKPVQVKPRGENKKDANTHGGKKNHEKTNPARLQFKIGQAHLDADDFEEALTALNRSIELDSSNAEAYVSRGITLHRMKETTRAIYDFDMAIELSPKWDWAYANRGYVYYLNEKYSEALADLNRAIELDDNYAPYYSNRGNVYFERGGEGDDLMALRDYQQAIELEPNADYHRYLADVYLRMGKLDLAEENLNDALGLEPGDIAAFALFAQVKDVRQREAQAT